MSTASYRFIVSGRVQGVYFRQSTRERAEALNLRGWVRNREDGCVEGLACGEAPALAQLHAWLQRGPAAARVEQVDWQRVEETAPAGFEVRRP